MTAWQRYNIRMAKDLSRHQEKIVKRYYEHQETIRANRLSDLVAEIWLCEDQKKATRLWGQVQVALMKAGCNANQAASVVGKRDTEALAKLVQAIDAGKPTGNENAVPMAPQPPDAFPPEEPRVKSVADGRTIEQMKREKAAAAGTDSLDDANLKRAMRAFRKKLKTSKLADESKLGGRYTTRGAASNIVAISPPYEYPAAVWQELARRGQLKYAGQGTYQLA